ncbi:MAG: methylenetetrahydrofolate--tRNA-(uracil(54)-C(5))-methyltransferase (FADH(2)-oxidizing) TrmFO [Eubacteriales bacterium]
MDKNIVNVIGAGLAGCECAWQLAEAGICVHLYEMKPKEKSPAHHSNLFGELVCSNSLRANNVENAVGLLKEELRLGNSLIISSADQNAVPAGGALAVDREKFSATITEKIKNHPMIKVISEKVENIPQGGIYTVIATGPLTEGRLAQEIAMLCYSLIDRKGLLDHEGKLPLHFYDAAAPIVSFESIDMDHAFFASRYDKGTPDYINCPMSKEEYHNFWQALTTAEEAPVHGFEDSKVFEGCKPVEVEGRRGEETLLYGCLKPVGLPDPKTGKEAYAVLQLRKDNQEGTMYNLVGFQTHLKFPEQQRVFSMIPALKNAEFLRYGVMHRNTFINSPQVLNRYGQISVKDPTEWDHDHLFFAGQITGVEGYVESTASGWLVGRQLAWHMQGKKGVVFPKDTAVGALQAYICDRLTENFQPMKMNFGLMTPLEFRVKRTPEEKKLMTAKQAKNTLIAQRALETFQSILDRKESEEAER